MSFDLIRVFLQSAGIQEFARQRKLFPQTRVKYKYFSVTKTYVGRLNSCVCHIKQIISQIIKDMRNVLILVLLCFCSSLKGATFYVSPSGSDSNPGTITQPFFTLNKAWSVVSAGDIVYMRGGTYNYGSTFTTFSGKNGSSGNYINIWAYPGEHPVIDYSSGSFSSQKAGISLSSASYIYLKGIRVTGIAMVSDWNHYGMILWNNVTNCVFEMMEFDHIGGWGVTIGDNCSNDLFLNCDSHHNQDPYSSEPYGGSDGFQSYSTSSTNITYRGCRSWANSDDGWDLRGTDGLFTLENCWSFWNGWRPPTVTNNYAQSGNWTDGGNGVGLKLAGGQTGTHSDVRRVVKNCLVFENRIEGISGNPTGSNWSTHEIYNTIVYNTRDGSGYVFEYGAHATLRNNISYANNAGNTQFGNGSVLTEDHNSWDGGTTVNNADFAGLNSAGMDGPRQADGSLPDLNFLKLASGSKLIDAGVNVGIAYTGNSPDLGAFEGGTGTTITVPVYTSGAIQSATPSVLEMTYNMTLANIIPATSAFLINVNSVARPVSSIVISGTKVQLTLASPVVTGDVITVSYTKPASNPVQTTSGGQAATISAQIVTNNVNTVGPVYVSSAVANATPTILEMTYGITLASKIPVASAFSVLVNSTIRTVNSVAISGTKVQLTLASAIKYGDIVTVAYSKPATNPLQNSSGVAASSMSAQSVINNLINPTKDAPITVALTITPNHVHKIINIVLSYSSAPTTALSPEIIRITDLLGTLLIEKLLVTGATNIRIPQNLDSGIYNVTLSAGGAVMAVQRMRVY